MAEALKNKEQEIGIPRLVMHLPAHGTAADEGKLSANLGVRKD